MGALDEILVEVEQSGLLLKVNVTTLTCSRIKYRYRSGGTVSVKFH